jgi:hypothetical protein
MPEAGSKGGERPPDSFRSGFSGQSRRLKVKYRLVHTASLNRIAKGWPKAWSSFGIASKSMP